MYWEVGAVMSAILIIAAICRFAYFKIRYPFWGFCPVFHPYDYFRGWYSAPFVIFPGHPVRTKYYNKQIPTRKYAELTDQEKNNVVNLVQCYTAYSADVFVNITRGEFDVIFGGHNHPAFVSWVMPTWHKPDNRPVACMATLPVTICLKCLGGIYKYDAFFADYLCVHPEYGKDGLERELFATHMYNQTVACPKINASIFKKNGVQYSGIVPLVAYATHTFLLPPKLINTVNPRSRIRLIAIGETNLDILIELFENLQNNPAVTVFAATGISNVAEMMRSKILAVSLVKLRGLNIGVYFFKKTHMHYDMVEGDSVACIGSYMYPGVDRRDFYAGYVAAIREIVRKTPAVKIMAVEDLLDNDVILGCLQSVVRPFLVTPAAYYLYNLVYPKSPVGKNKCMFVL